MAYGQISDTPPPRRPSLSGYAVEAVVAGLLLVFLVVAVVPTWLLGGFRLADDPLPTIQPGQTVAYDKFKITPISAKWVKGKTGDDALDSEKHDKVVVLVRVTNRSKKPVYNVEDDFRLTPPGRSEPVAADQAHSVQDENGLSTPLPGLPEKVALSWKVPKGAGPPDSTELTIMKETYEEDFISRKLRWQDPDPWVKVTLPVEQEAS